MSGSAASVMRPPLGSAPLATTSDVEEVFPGFEAWYLAQHPKVLAALVLVSGSTDVAREATDEAFARALAQWPRVQAMESPGGWLYTVALNLVRRHARRASTARNASLLAQPSLIHTDTTGELWSVVQDLPARQRAAVVLRYLVDMKEREIAAVMGISPGTVASTLAAARLRMAKWLDEEQGPT